MTNEREVAPRKERRAFKGWVGFALIVAVAAIAAAAYVLLNHHAPVVAPR